ncbi:MAG TPA: mechanosensitive ion channel family protein [Methylomirabilota bacterium]|nr:mechanosensitive ion channel family protein [Methylomirabilota bacterium]
MDPRLTDALWAGVPALILLAGTVVLIRAVCRRPPFRRLIFALSLGALAGSLALFGYLAPVSGEGLRPYLQVLILFTIAYAAFKVVEVMSVDVVAVRRGRAAPPAILRDIVSVLFAALVLIVLMRARLGVDVTALVATSAALSIVLGLALQETLSNLFAGLAVMIERPFEPGDWVRFGDRVGRVKEVSWRAVKLQLLRQDDYLVIPNSVVAKSEIVNLSQPTPLHGQSVEVGVVYGEPPNRVIQALVDAALEVDRVLRDPRPFAVVRRYDSFSIHYRVTYWISDFAHADLIEGEVLSHIWYAFRRQGIRIPYPISEVNWRDVGAAEAAARREELGRIAGLLRGIDFLAALTQEELDRLAMGAQIAPYPAGMVVVRQGEAGDSLFVIARGRVQVTGQPPGGGAERPIAIIEPASYFGEMSLLTGAPRSATVRALEDTECLVLTKDALRPVLLSDPAAAERLSQAMTRRKAEQETFQRVPVEIPEVSAEPPHFLLGRMRRFFDLIGGDV